MSKNIITSHGFETDLARYFFVISHGFPFFLRVKRGLSITVDVRRLDSYCVARVIYRWKDGGDKVPDLDKIDTPYPGLVAKNTFLQAILKYLEQIEVIY